ncbi:carbohydrate kinase [Pseudohoeflea suaedae]|uniref:Carbohydrate kinase n=1 Tax=Pseudohoeflea suaedae TaxID=877384 RepID=A0A4R5PPS1_9HYPH|nr:FGGY-family carbohydrate kinase [Pseudohoeflea suaedae]TDH39076.1 carbohydrate kinase [Pseudohoeflea suaedae]
MDCILAIDSGLTVTKAVLFDLAGRQLGVVRRNVRQLMPHPRHVERDMDDLWSQTASAIREVIAGSGIDAGDILAVATTAHGDGIYLLDEHARPLGAGVLSLDSRAAGIVAGWQKDGTAEKSLELTGQAPHAAAPSSLLAWFKANEPDRFSRIGHMMACKDWLRYCLCGVIGTDRTEASTSFTDVRTQDYSEDALALFGLSSLAGALPPSSHPAAIVGEVNAEAARASGLRQGTPVAAGVHDVTASVLGIAAHVPGVVGIVAGTYSINECVSAQPRVGPDWLCRNAIEPGLWNNMAISPASTTNYEWFLDTFCVAEREKAEAEGRSIHAVLAPELEEALRRASSVVYHPYLFGSPMGPAPSASFMGLRGWHGRGDVLASLLEGIAFNHRDHVDVLRRNFGADVARLTGGASRNPVVAKLFADILDMPVTVTGTDEAAAWGAALCAGAAVGAFERFDADPRDLEAVSTTYRPDPARAAHYHQRYAVYREIASEMRASWDRLNELDQKVRGAQ